MNVEMLAEAVGVRRMLSPHYHGKDLIQIRCYNDFEGHGRASETWEEHWEIVLPQHQYYWLTSTKEWRMGKPGIKAKFHDRTLNGCMLKAQRFLEEIGDVARSHSQPAVQG